MLAFDFGERRIGVAVGNTITGTAEPQVTIACKVAQVSRQAFCDWRLRPPPPDSPNPEVAPLRGTVDYVAMP